MTKDSNNILVINQAPTTEFRLGLEQEGMQLNPSAETSFPIPNVRNRWAHGLNEEDRKLVEEFHGRRFDDPDAYQYWNSIRFDWKNYLSSYDMDDPRNILMISCAKQTGLCAIDLEQIDNNPNARFSFVVHRSRELEEAKYSLYEKQDTAKAELLKVKRSSKKYLLALAYFCTPEPSEIGTNDALAYVRLRNLIEGEYTQTKVEGVDKFMAAKDMSKDRLYTAVNVRKAYRLNIIRRNGDRMYFNPMTNVEYGRTQEAVTDYFLNPKNQEEYGAVKDPEPYSILAQLKRQETL